MALLAGKVALITGAGRERGIGAAIARRFAHDGAKVAVHYHSSDASARSIAAEVGGTAFPADLRDPAASVGLVDEVLEQFGRIDILVNNAAGFTHGAEFKDDSWLSYRTEIDEVLATTFHPTRAVVPHMVAQNFGRIINFGATLLVRPAPGYGPHIVAKSAVAGLTRSLCRELGPFGITVNIIHPGMTLSDYTLSLPDEARERVRRITPLRELAEPDDVASAALFFASDLGSFVTGAGLSPDGGLAVLS